jgi:hypothetical protein
MGADRAADARNPDAGHSVKAPQGETRGYDAGKEIVGRKRHRGRHRRAAVDGQSDDRRHLRQRRSQWEELYGARLYKARRRLAARVVSLRALWPTPAIQYTGKGGNTQRYVCRRAFGAKATSMCIGFGGMRVDRAIAREVLDRCSLLGLKQHPNVMTGKERIFLVRHIGRMAFSTGLVSSSRRPSSRKRVSRGQ